MILVAKITICKTDWLIPENIDIRWWRHVNKLDSKILILEIDLIPLAFCREYKRANCWVAATIPGEHAFKTDNAANVTAPDDSLLRNSRRESNEGKAKSGNKTRAPHKAVEPAGNDDNEKQSVAEGKEGNACRRRMGQETEWEEQSDETV